MESPNAAGLDRGKYTDLLLPSPAGPQGKDGSSLVLERVPLPETPEGLQSSQRIARPCTADLNADGLPDIICPGPGGKGVTLLLNKGKETFEIAPPLPSESEMKGTAPGRLFDETVAGVACGDIDNDGFPEILVLGRKELRLFKRGKGGAYREMTARGGLVITGRPSDAVFFDFNHDGFLDLAVAMESGPLCCVLFLNRDGKTFQDVTRRAGITRKPAGPGRLACLDSNGDTLADLIVVRHKGPPLLLKNGGGGRFVCGEPFAGAAGLNEVSTADWNQDGWTDVLLAGAAGVKLFLNNKGSFEMRPVAQGLPWITARLCDVDADGFPDVLAFGDGGCAVFLNRGAPVQAAPSGAVKISPAGSFDFQALAESDALHIIVPTRAETLAVLRLRAPRGRCWQSISLKGLRNNSLGIGAVVELREGAYYHRESVWRSPSPAGAPQGRTFDSVRVTWPNGLIQSWVDVAAGGALVLKERPGAVGSCPFLYGWDGRRFTFVCDFLGVGALGFPIDENHDMAPRSTEHVFIDGSLLRSVEGRRILRITEELAEVTYLDGARLFAVDHPPDVRIVSGDKVTDGTAPLPMFYAVRNVRPVAGAWGTNYGDVWEALREEDGVCVDDFIDLPLQYEGFAEKHTLTLDLGDLRGAREVLLLLTGRFAWTDSSSMLAAARNPSVGFIAPFVEAPDGRGRWVKVIGDMGFPDGTARTIAVDLKGKIRSCDPRIRITTNLRIYWDCARVATERGAAVVRPLRLIKAHLHRRGCSRIIGGIPDYSDLIASTPWTTQSGLCTRYGDVRSLLLAHDDSYAIIQGGDEAALEFEDVPQRPGDVRDFVLRAEGWMKDRDYGTKTGATIEPLPYRAMGSYPPRKGRLPAYKARQHTRVVRPVGFTTGE
jgi:hypothetical protein